MAARVLSLGAAAATTVTHPREGVVLWRTWLRGTEGDACEWCGMGRRLAMFTWRGPATYVYESRWYCSLHCWGQQHGFTDL